MFMNTATVLNKIFMRNSQLKMVEHIGLEPMTPTLPV